MTINPLLDSPLKPPPPPSELEEFMSRDPLSLTSQDIDKLIAMQRANRARREAPKGAKGKRGSDLQDGSGIDLTAMMAGAAIPKAQPETETHPGVSLPKSTFRRL